MNKALRVAIYLRVSTEEQRLHGLSIDAQKEILTKWVKDNGHIVIDYYIDAGITARKKMNHRKELLRLLNDVESHKIDLVIFTKLDRWFRNISDYYKVQEIMDRNKTNWKTILEDYDTSTASGRLHINIMLSIAQDEADRTSERIKVVFENKIEKGEMTNASAAYGYKIVNHKLVIDDEKAARVREVFDMYELKRSFCGTQRWYMQKYNENVSYGFISKMVKNEIYTGKKKDNRDFCEPIISVNQFNKVNSIKKESFSRLGKTGAIYVFSGLCICGTCGYHMNGVMCYNPKPTKYYSCRYGAHYTNCSHNKRCREDWIEEKALLDFNEYIKKTYLDVNIKEVQTVSMQSTKTSDTENIKRKMKRLKDLYVADLIDMNEYRVDYNNYKNQLNKIESEERETPTALPDDILSLVKSGNYENVYLRLNDEYKRRFWHELIEKIEITDNNDIRIIFK